MCKPVVQSAEWPGSPGKPGGETSPGAMAGRLLGGDELELSGVGLSQQTREEEGEEAKEREAMSRNHLEASVCLDKRKGGAVTHCTLRN